jgi:hypothetical protein
MPLQGRVGAGHISGNALVHAAYTVGKFPVTILTILALTITRLMTPVKKCTGDFG